MSSEDKAAASQALANLDTLILAITERRRAYVEACTASLMASSTVEDKQRTDEALEGVLASQRTIEALQRAREHELSINPRSTSDRQALMEESADGVA